MLARADEGWVLGMGYSTQRGYAYTHPFGGEIRYGAVPLEIVPDELGFAIEIGEIELTDCQMVNHFAGSATMPPQFTRGQGLVFGHGERKAMAMSLVDRVLRADEFDEQPTSPAQDSEFVLSHGDNVEASGFVQHLKLPHYVTFESELQLVRKLREEAPGMNGYNFAYLDEGTKRMIRRSMLKAVAIPGHQVPFGSREMPLAYGWGTGGIQVTAAVIGESDVLKVIDQGSATTPPTPSTSAASSPAPPAWPPPSARPRPR